MRDNLKNKAYYQAYLDYQYVRIEKKTAKLEKSEGEKRQRVLLSLTSFEVDLLKAEFSYGASQEDLKSLLIRAMNIISENKNVTYEDLLTLLSLAVMLEAGNNAKGLIDSNRNVIKEDRLLNYLSFYLETNSIVWDRNIPLKKEYVLLDCIFNAVDKESVLNEYLSKWYEAHKGFAWHNSHLRDTDTYCGYWSFESAAVAKIENMNLGKINNSAYFPIL